MANNIKKHMDSSPSSEVGAPFPPSRWLKVLAVLGGVGLTGGHGAVLAQSQEAVHLNDLLTAEENHKTTADYLELDEANARIPRPSARVQLGTSTASPNLPSFSSASRSSKLPLEKDPMQLIVPPPSPAALVSEAPAPAASMVESMQQSGAAASGSEASNSAVSMPTAQDIANRAAMDADASVQGAMGPDAIRGNFIDSTDYSVGATQAPATTPNVIFAERSTGCQISVPSGQTAPSSTCGAVAAQPGGGATSDRGIQVGPVNVSSRGVTLGNTTVISREFLNEKLRPLNVLRRGNEEYVFPLSIPAPITSLFGWRMHPIHQSWRFHSGTDLAAPEGTPVVATRSGRVAVSDNLGGYGLTVILRHDEDNLESRYAHLSRVAVRPGEWVEQGEVIGLVGSTGTSTGPHLHFEMRQMTGQGWVAVDAKEVLEYGIANLMEIVNNPLMALGKVGEADAGNQSLPADYPFRPAQPNAS